MSEWFEMERLTKKHVFRRLLGYAKPFAKGLSIAFIVLMLATAADVSMPYLIKVFIDDHLTSVLEHEGQTFHWQMVGMIGVLYFLLLMSAVLLHYFQLFTFQKIAHEIVQRIRMDVFGKVQHLGLTFFDQTPGGSLVSRITNDTEAMKELYISVLSTFVQSMIFILGIFIAMFVLDVQLALFCLIILPVIFAIMMTYRFLSSKVYHVARSKLSQLNAKLSESLQGMNIIQAFRQERRLRRSFGQTNTAHYEASLKNVKLSGLLLRPAVDLVYLLSLIIVLSYFGLQPSQFVIELGVLFAFINLLDRLFEPINMMMMRLSQFQQAIVSAQRVFGLLDDDRYAPSKKGTQKPKITEGKIEFKNVTFSYDGKTDVLKDISFTAEPGQTVALVGHTGSGKSTITNLFMRFYPVEKGEIYIDGAPLNHYAEEELRRKMGLVLQDPFMFVGDIKHNIRLHNDWITDEEVKEAARFVQADSFIDKLPHRYDEPVTERGATLSSGQRQLISFARTMALQPKILVLDEATASVDTQTEEAIQMALDRMRRGRTTIAIAHRLSTIQDADLILVLYKGEIVEQGTHHELIKQKGLYHKMYLLQQGATDEIKEAVHALSHDS